MTLITSRASCDTKNDEQQLNFPPCRNWLICKSTSSLSGLELTKFHKMFSEERTLYLKWGQSPIFSSLVIFFIFGHGSFLFRKKQWRRKQNILHISGAAKTKQIHQIAATLHIILGKNGSQYKCVYSIVYFLGEKLKNWHFHSFNMLVCTTTALIIICKTLP